MSRGFLRKSSVNTFIGIVWILFAVGTSAQNAVSKFRADSIRQSLSRIQKPQDKIPLLKELIGLYYLFVYLKSFKELSFMFISVFFGNVLQR